MSKKSHYTEEDDRAAEVASWRENPISDRDHGYIPPRRMYPTNVYRKSLLKQIVSGEYHVHRHDRLTIFIVSVFFFIVLGIFIVGALYSLVFGEIGADPMSLLEFLLTLGFIAGLGYLCSICFRWMKSILVDWIRERKK
jgi:hypothetical protein